MHKSLIFFAAAVCFFSFTLFCEAEDKHGSFFAGAGLSYAVEQFDDGGLTGIPDNSRVDNSWGFNAFAGYWWLKHLAFEGNYNWYADFDGQTASGNGFDISIWTAMLDVKVLSPCLWQNRVFPYLKIGGGFMAVDIDAQTVSSDEWDWAYNVGLGFDVFVTHHLTIGLDGKHVWGTGDVSDFNHFLGALRAAYHF